MSARSWLSAAVFLAAAGCLDGEPTYEAQPLDVAFFECNVQPILDRSCAFTACHGDPGRPLFVYSMSKTRIAGEALRGERLTDKELCSNYFRAAAFARKEPSRSQLITKPAALDGTDSQYHAGNYLFGEGDVEARCLELWMRGTVAEPGSPAPEACDLPWRRSTAGGSAPACEPRKVTCSEAIHDPDLPQEPAS